MIRRYPYWGWLLLSLSLWIITGFHFFSTRQSFRPEKITEVIAADIQKREQAFDDFAKDKDLIQRLFSSSISPREQERLNKLPFYVFAYESGNLAYWNTNDMVGSCAVAGSDRFYFYKTERGAFLERCFPLAQTGPDTARKLVILLPITTQYPIENNYLRSHFLAADYIPATTVLTARPVSGAYPVKDNRGQPMFFIQYHAEDFGGWPPDQFMIWLLVAALSFSVLWLQLIAIYLTRTRSQVAGLWFTLLVIVLCRSLIYLYGLPFNLDNIAFFSPRLYASSAALSSLGDLVINTLCLLWIIIFILRHTHYRAFLANVRSGLLKAINALALTCLMVACCFEFVNIIKSLVLDSSISFDVSHFYSINVYTIFGLFTIVLITGTSCLFIYLLQCITANIARNKWVRYLLLAIVGFAAVLLVFNGELFYYYLLLWLLVFVFFLDVKNFSIVSDLFAPQMVFWAIYICLFCTFTLQQFNHTKEMAYRKVFANQRIAPERDDVTEFSFNNIAGNIQKDKTVRAFIKQPVQAGRKAINEYLDARYLGGQLNKYQAKVYLFDKNKTSLFNKDTTSYNTLTGEIDRSTPTSTQALYYKEYLIEGHHYIAYLPLYVDSTNAVAGYVFIDLSLKQAVNETVYPELLQPASIKANPSESEYAYAIYNNNKLVVQTNDYPFPVMLKEDTLKPTQYFIYDHAGSSELWYKLNERKTVIVVHYYNLWLEVITLFSYLFGILILLAAFILFCQLYLSYLGNPGFKGMRLNLTLRRRVHFSMLAVVLVSFIIIGIVTILFFTSEYKNSNIDKIKTAMQAVSQSVQQFLKQEEAFESEGNFDVVARSTRFKYFITGLAASQKIDINLYNSQGTLDVTSQDDIYDKGLLSRIIRPDAYYQMVVLGKSILIQDERVGGLPYLSCYVPLRDDEGNTLGYINVPFFSSERDLNFQISNIVVTLINLYAFIFLISSLFTVFITRWLTRTLNIIIRQFGKLNLQQNELIDWPYDDEIGFLVREYNKMVRKVEENAALLAQSERETAWREMARQVAHEIKNPLTPMKLNIQYLQNALRNNHPEVKQLAERVCHSLVEQIDNLSYIASEFSNFAKMPEARPEDIDIALLLGKVVELYLDEANVKVDLRLPGQPVTVFSDRSQLIRVFTNLVENAKQAIPEGRKGLITVQLTTEGNMATIKVTDNGAGIPEDVVQKIFQPYFTTKSSGTGLGLAMTKKIIEFWHGEIGFETKEGEGTTFFITLPEAKPE